LVDALEAKTPLLSPMVTVEYICTALIFYSAYMYTSQGAKNRGQFVLHFVTVLLESEI
jgi:hypothetical protein